MKKLKTDLSISEIGNFRFYSGILIGIGYGFILNFLFQLLSKANNIVAASIDGNWNRFLNSDLSLYYSLIIGFLSVSLAFCFTSYLWMSKPIELNRRKNQKIRFAQANSIFIFGVIFLILTRFFAIYIGFNYDGFAFDIKEYFGIGIFLLPTFIFLFNWVFISKIYRTKKIMLISLILLIIYGFILSGIKT